MGREAAYRTLTSVGYAGDATVTRARGIEAFSQAIMALYLASEVNQSALTFASRCWLAA